MSINTITSREYPTEIIKTNDMIEKAQYNADPSKTETENYAPYSKKDDEGNPIFSGTTTTYFDKSGNKTGSVSKVPYKDIAMKSNGNIDENVYSTFVTLGNEQYIDFDGDGNIDTIDKKIDLVNSDEYKEWRQEYESALEDFEFQKKETESSTKYGPGVYNSKKLEGLLSSMEEG